MKFSNFTSLVEIAASLDLIRMNLMTNARDSLNEKYEGYHTNKIIVVSAEEQKSNDESSIHIMVEYPLK